VLTYANSLNGAFVLDDQSTIVDNRQIREWWSPASVLVPESDTAIAGRPIVNLSFALNYAIGGTEVRGYHVGNILLHILCGLLAFGVIRRTLALPKLGARFGERGVDIAAAIALLWIVHPLNSEVVDYLTERTESLMALFYLLTLYAAIRAAEATTNAASARVSRQMSGRWQLIAVIACGLGMACKESMVTAPLMVLLYDRAFVYDSFGSALRSRRALYSGLALTWLVLAALMSAGPRSAVGGFSTGVSPWLYLLNQTRIITHYLRLAFWPQSLVVFYGWPVALTLRDVLPEALLLTALLGVTAVGFAKAPPLGFLGLWFFITLAPTSSIVPIATEVGAERRMYLPLLAVAAAVVIGVWEVLRRLPGSSPLDRSAASPRRFAGATVVGAVLLASTATALAAGTVVRNREYASAITLARTVVARRPTAVTHHYLAEQLVQAGQHEEARQHLHDAVAEGDSRARYLLGLELFNAGKLSESMEQLYAFVATANLPYRLVPHWLEPPKAEIVSARLILAREAAMQGGWSRSADEARRVLSIAPENREALIFLADALFAQQRFEEAGAEYQKYLSVGAANAHVLTNLGITFVAAGKLDEAIRWFRQAVDVAPRDATARRVLATALLDRGDAQGAVAQAREAVAISPNDPAMRDVLAQAETAVRRGR
jgi:tetratricopeptide (TPR) repeat protein